MVIAVIMGRQAERAEELAASQASIGILVPPFLISSSILFYSPNGSSNGVQVLDE